MENSILIEKLTNEELEHSIRAIIREELEEFKNSLPELINEDDLLTRKEVADLLQIDLSTIHNWTKKGRLKSYGIGNRVYFRRKDIDEALIPLR